MCRWMHVRREKEHMEEREVPYAQIQSQKGKVGD